jgi:chromosome segregation ATPase
VRQQAGEIQALLVSLATLSSEKDLAVRSSTIVASPTSQIAQLQQELANLSLPAQKPAVESYKDVCSGFAVVSLLPLKYQEEILSSRREFENVFSENVRVSQASRELRTRVEQLQRQLDLRAEELRLAQQQLLLQSSSPALAHLEARVRDLQSQLAAEKEHASLQLRDALQRNQEDQARARHSLAAEQREAADARHAQRQVTVLLRVSLAVALSLCLFASLSFSFFL